MTLHVLLVAALAAPQYDPERPEPVGPLAGALVLAGEGELGAETARRFVESAKGERVLLLVAGPPRADELRLFVPPAEVASVRAPDGAELSALVGAAGAVWIGGEQASRFAAALAPGAPLAGALAELLARGGTVGAAGATAGFLAGDGAGLLAGFALESDRTAVDARLDLRPDVPVITLAAGAGAFASGRTLVPVVGAVVVRVAGDPYALPGGTFGYAGDRPFYDLVALSRAARARLRPTVQGVPRLARGALVLAGGGPTPDEVCARFVALAGGPDAPLVFLPGARGTEGEPPFVARLRAAGARDVTWLRARDRAAADGDPALLDALGRARGVWLGSGHAYELIDLYEQTAVHRLLDACLARGGVVGGASAGAAVQAQVLLRGGPFGSRELFSAGYEEGFGLLPGCAVDAHFSERSRFPDLLAVKRARPDVLCIGIDEGTALVVVGQAAEVVGRGAVVFFDGDEAPLAPEGAATRVASGERYELGLRAAVVD